MRFDLGMILRGLIGAIAFAAIIFGAFSSRKHDHYSDPFGDWPSMTPLGQEWISKQPSKRVCTCNREPMGA